MNADVNGQFGEQFGSKPEEQTHSTGQFVFFLVNITCTHILDAWPMSKIIDQECTKIEMHEAEHGYCFLNNGGFLPGDPRDRSFCLGWFLRSAPRSDVASQGGRMVHQLRP